MTGAALRLPEVTLVAIASVNVEPTIRALQASLAKVDFANCKLFTDAAPSSVPDGITIVPIPRLSSSAEYSRFILGQLADHVETDFCLVCQWDGYVLHPEKWTPDFLQYDYIGASWPHFASPMNVGNGGFSLRSKRLLDLCAADGFAPSHPEDRAVCHHNRDWLEQQGITFAPRVVADRFSAERASSPDETFGFHGIWHMPRILGAEGFWDMYQHMDDRGTVQHDFPGLLRQVIKGQGGLRRGVGLIRHRFLKASQSGRPLS